MDMKTELVSRFWGSPCSTGQRGVLARPSPHQDRTVSTLHQILLNNNCNRIQHGWHQHSTSSRHFAG